MENNDLPEKPTKIVKQLTLGMRCTVKQAEQVRNEAAARGMHVSQLLRELVLGALGLPTSLASDEAE